MEKTAIKQTKFFRGLLSFTLILLVNQFSYGDASPSLIRSLTVKKDAADFFTAQENGYTLKIPDTQPGFVQTDLPVLPDGIQLVSSKREEYLDSNGERGTAIHLWFNFKEAGPVRLPPLIVSIKNRTYYLPFEEVMVFENPALISPELVIEFESGITDAGTYDGVRRVFAKANQEIIFTVSLKYFVQLVSFNRQLPKNSIFEELERFSVSRGVPVGKDFSSEPVKLARFSWKPLVEGSYALPEIVAVATSYNGARKTVRLPPYLVRVLKDGQTGFERTGAGDKGRSGEEIFPSAFAKTLNLDLPEKIRVLSNQDCKKLSELRSREQNTLLYFAVRAERRVFERALGLSNGSDEVSKPLVYALISLSLILITLFALFVFFRKTKFAIFALIFSLCTVIFSVWGITELYPDYAIFSGGVISPVPETSTQSLHRVNGGFRVKISERTENYYYIESEELNGWVLKNTIYEIR